jgi:hypothetical protein
MASEENKSASVTYSIHPEYLDKSDEWSKWRSILGGGDDFIEAYVEQFSDAEETPEFNRRKRVTPVAGFAKAAVFDVKNSIFQRMDAIRRLDGTVSWRKANRGELNGVDLQGSTMDHYIGTEILSELLAMGKVGIFVDNSVLGEGLTLAQTKGVHPYVYTFQTEDIRNWEYFLKGSQLRLKQVLLRVRSEPTEDSFGMLSDWVEQYRHFFVEDDGSVWLQVFNSDGNKTDLQGNEEFDEPIRLSIDEIPLVILELKSSLLEDIANHQIALTNLESADVSFLMRANTPFYTEQFDQRFDAIHNQGNEDYYNVHEYDEDNSDQAQPTDNVTTAKFGGSDGRRYGKELDRPGFIHPSSEPVTASMHKQTQLKNDIRTLINLAISNTKSRFASAESKELDERGLESGLSAIGLILEHAERRIAELWLKYEDSDELAYVKYPERYSLRSDEERRKDAQQLSDSASDVSSVTFRREVQKEIAEILLGGKIPDTRLDAILKEIDASTAPTADAKEIRSDVEAGLVTRATASVARGWPEGEADKAQEEKIEMDAARAEAQAKARPESLGETNLAARGVTKDDPLEAAREKQESQNPENDPDGIKRVRGEGK